MSPSVIVTAGGTIESIDDVRLVSVHRQLVGDPLSLGTSVEIENISKGGFGKTIAEAFAERGVRTTLIGRRSLIRSLPRNELNYEVRSFRSTAELQNVIREECRKQRPDYFLMAAAVSDYSPVAFEGKLSSDEEEMVIRLKRNPKILDELRELTGPQTILVGFKLVSGLSEEQLVAIAQKQNARAALDFTVANDMQEIDFEKGIHPIKIVTSTGAVTPVTGERSYVAKRLVEFLLTHKLH